MLVLPHVLLYHKSIRAQLSMTFRQNRALVMFGDTRNVVKSLACGSWFYNVLVSLPTSRVLYFADKVIESCALMLKNSWVLSHYATMFLYSFLYDANSIKGKPKVFSLIQSESTKKCRVIYVVYDRPFLYNKHQQLNILLHFLSKNMVKYIVHWWTQIRNLFC